MTMSWAVAWSYHAGKGVIYINPENKDQNKADFMAEVLNDVQPYVGIAADNYPMLYIQDGENRYCVKKVNIYNETSKKTEGKWVNLGIARQRDQEAPVDPALLDAYKKLIAAGMLPKA